MHYDDEIYTIPVNIIYNSGDHHHDNLQHIGKLPNIIDKVHIECTNDNLSIEDIAQVANFIGDIEFDLMKG